jgi:hypothetical protein
MAYLRSPLDTNPTVSRESVTGFKRLPGHFPVCERCDMAGETMQWLLRIDASCEREMKLYYYWVPRWLYIHTCGQRERPAGLCLLGLRGFPNGDQISDRGISVPPNVRLQPQQQTVFCGGGFFFCFSSSDIFFFFSPIFFLLYICLRVFPFAICYL